MRKALSTSTKWLASVVLILGLSAPALGAELSFLSTLYQKEANKTNGTDSGGKSTITFGGRYGEDLDDRTAWYGEGTLRMISFEAPSGSDAPSSKTSLSVGGGLRMYFEPFSESVAPYLAAKAAFKSLKDGSTAVGSYTESETSGLFYGASCGIRVGLDAQFFLDVESDLFESALTSTTKNTTVTPTGKTDTETTDTELFADTTTQFGEIVISLGMKF